MSEKDTGSGKVNPSQPSTAAPGAAVASVRHPVWTGFCAALGLGRGRAASGARADESTRLAVERSYLAADRTLMAWIRTALSMISFGFTIGKLGQTVKHVEVKGLVFKGVRTVSIESLAYVLVVLGTVALFGAILEYLVGTAEYANMGLRRRISLPMIVSVVLVVMGGLAFTSLVLGL